VRFTKRARGNAAFSLSRFSAFRFFIGVHGDMSASLLTIAENANWAILFA
jgi:hypothetical protein